MPDTRIASPKRHWDSLVLGLTALAALAISIGSFWPPSGAGGPPGQDKLLHALAFAALVFPAAFATPRHLIWIVPGAVVYGAAIEIIQPFAGRSAEWLDLASDVIGIAIGVAAGRFLARFSPR